MTTPGGRGNSKYKGPAGCSASNIFLEQKVRRCGWRRGREIEGKTRKSWIGAHRERSSKPL
jgi:hypothetical protein